MATADIERVKLDNTLRRFKRYLNVGFESSEFLKSSSELDNIQSLHELITEFPDGGKMAAEQIRSVNQTGKLINRSHILTALAFCARNSNSDLVSKRGAYAALKDVCLTPYELFLFLDKREFFNVQFLLKSSKVAVVVPSSSSVVERSVSTGEIKPETKRTSRPSSSASVKNDRPVIVDKFAKLGDSARAESPRNPIALPKINHDPALATPRLGSAKKPLSPIPKAGTARDDKPQLVALAPQNSGKPGQQLSSKGWGRLQRKSINDWYTSQDALKLARSIISYPGKYKWRHRDVLRLAHPKSSSLAHNYIFRYVTGGLAQADKFYESAVKADGEFKTKQEKGGHVLTWQVETKLSSIKDHQTKKRRSQLPTRTSHVSYQLTSEQIKELDSVRQLLAAYESLKSCKEEQEVCKLVTEFSFTDHQVPGKWLNSHAIWLAVLEAKWFTPAVLVRRFMKLARRNLVRKNLADANSQPDSSDPAAVRIEELICQKLSDINSAEPAVQPVEIFTVLRLYDHAKNDRKANRFFSRKASWPVNERVNQALNQALELSFKRAAESSREQRKLCFSLNCFKQSRARTRKNSSITPFQAMVLMFYQQLHESAPTSRTFGISGGPVDLNIQRDQSFQVVKTTLFNTYLGSGSGNHYALEKALTDKEKYDAFVIYTNMEPSYRKKLVLLFAEYRRDVMGGKQKCKLVFISFTKISRGIVTDSTNANILELTGLSNQTPQIIDNFLNDLF